jgi:DNA polymerase elongation subunit (family B)
MIKSDKISPYQFYSTDIDYPQYYSVEYFLNHPHDTIEKNQKLKILFLDIEVYMQGSTKFPKPEEGEFPVSAITTYLNTKNKFTSYFLLLNKNIQKFPVEDLEKQKQDYLNTLLQNKYITDKDTLEIKIFTNETELLKTFWEDVKTDDPACLTGWNSDQFDLPYLYYRTVNVLNGDEKRAHKLMSKFGQVKVRAYGGKIVIDFPEFINMDLYYLYKPRAEGGLAQGKTMASYSLDFVSEQILKLKKLEYKNEGMSLDMFYEADPVGYLLYNIMDCCLVNLLNNKLGHPDRYNMLRRLMKTPLGIALRGPSALFDTFVLHELTRNGQGPRFGILDETSVEIPEHEIRQIPTQKTSKKIKWGITEISQETYRAITCRYPGAYVKDSPGLIYDLDDGILIDLDATSLYPSMICQYNISFDTFHGRVIDPIVTKSLVTIDNIIKSNGPIADNIYIGLCDMASKYVYREEFTNKNDYTQQVYYITCYLIKKIKEHGKELDKLFHPKDYKDYIVLKRYLLPLIDLLEDLSSNSEEYNTFAHDYLLMDKTDPEVKSLLIVENITKPTICVNRILVEDFPNYLKQQKLVFTLTGCLFNEHNDKISIFYEFLTNMKNMRDQYKRDRDSNEEGSEKYRYFDMMQNATKVTMNSTYGLYGMSLFRYSNKWLAKTITISGRLTLKLAQRLSDVYISSLKENN